MEWPVITEFFCSSFKFAISHLAASLIIFFLFFYHFWKDRGVDIVLVNIFSNDLSTVLFILTVISNTSFISSLKPKKIPQKHLIFMESNQNHFINDRYMVINFAHDFWIWLIHSEHTCPIIIGCVYKQGLFIFPPIKQ